MVLTKMTAYQNLFINLKTLSLYQMVNGEPVAIKYGALILADRKNKKD
jgi:hypothetical protein